MKSVGSWHKQHQALYYIHYLYKNIKWHYILILMRQTSLKGTTWCRPNEIHISEFIITDYWIRNGAVCLLLDMMTSWDGKYFRITGLSEGNIPATVESHARGPVVRDFVVWLLPGQPVEQIVQLPIISDIITTTSRYHAYAIISLHVWATFGGIFLNVNHMHKWDLDSKHGIY